jgi:NAD(P)-dependent dehydrogenase (short-subunit alcohol dehydrogenase family)
MTQRTVVVTGVTRGLGRSMAHGFAAAGHRVLGCGRNTDALTQLSDELGAEHDFRQVDVSGDDVDVWARDVIERFGAPDLVVNNAALINTVTELWRVPPEEFEALLDVNVNGVYRVVRAFLPPMLERGSGVVVNFSSGWGRSTSPGVAPYCATKFAVEGLTGALAQELPPGVAAVALSPGVIDTDMLRIAWGDGAAAYPKPESWAERAVPLLLGLGPEHNGQSLTV